MGISQGAVGCFLSTSTSPEFLLTAGHLFRGSLRLVEAEGATVGELLQNLLDTHDGVDGALVELTPAGVNRAIDAASERPYPLAVGDDATIYAGQARAYLPTRNSYSSYQKTRFGFPEAIMDVPGRPRYSVYNAIATENEFTLPGDSGSLLMNAAQTAFGLVAGEYNGCSIFQPLNVLLEIFAKDHPGLDLWKPRITSPESKP